MDEIQVSNGIAKLGSHVQYTTRLYEWDKSKPIGPDNSPKMTGPFIRACGCVIEIRNDPRNPTVIVESGMDRVSLPPEEITLTEEHAGER